MTEAVNINQDFEELAAEAAVRKARQAAGARKYEQLMAKSRELAAAGDMENAKRVAEIALKYRSNAMTVFEIAGPDGTVYEVEAPDIETAAAVNSMGSPDKPWGQVLKENLLGDDDPTTQNTGEKIGSFLNKAGESLTFGLVGDEASAAVESLVPGVDYADRRDHYRSQEEQFRENHPVASFGAELAPLAIPGVGAAGVAAKGTGLGARMLRGGAASGAAGASYGFMEGEGGVDQRLTDAGTAGALSAGLGVAAPLIGKGINRFADGRAQRKAVNQMVKEAPSPESLKAQAAELYGAGRTRGQIVDQASAQSLADDVAETLKREGVMRSDGSLITRDPDARRILDELQDLVQFGLDGSQVKPVRELFQGAAKDANPARARIGKILLDKYDDFVAKNAPEFRQGDELYRRAKKAEAVDQMVDLADTSDNANALRNEFRKADRNQIRGKLGGMTEDEVTGLQQVARGSRVENVARAAGRSAPRSIGSALFTGGVPFSAGALAGSPTIGALVGTAALGGGVVGRAVSNRMQRKHADIVKALMATGGNMPKAEASDSTVNAIARILSGLSPRAGTAIGSSF